MAGINYVYSTHDFALHSFLESMSSHLLSIRAFPLSELMSSIGSYNERSEHQLTSQNLMDRLGSKLYGTYSITLHTFYPTFSRSLNESEMNGLKEFEFDKYLDNSTTAYPPSHRLLLWLLSLLTRALDQHLSLFSPGF